MKGQRERGKRKPGWKKRWFVNTDRVPVSSHSVHAGEIPACCWLLHYISSSFPFELETWWINGMAGRGGAERETEAYNSHFSLTLKGIMKRIPLNGVLALQEHPFQFSFHKLAHETIRDK